ncbi:MAG: ATP-binding protein [bacterium]
MLEQAVITIQLLDYFSSIIFFYLLIYVWQKNSFSSLNRACAWLVASFFIWSFSLIFIHNPFITKGLAILFYDLGCLGWASFPVLALNFVLILSGRKKIGAWRVLFFLLPLFFIGLQWFGYLAADYPRQAWGWGYHWSPTFWAIAYYLYVLLFLTSTFALLFRIWLKGEDEFVRGQGLIMLLTGLPSLALAFLVDVILPKFDGFLFPNIAPVFVLIFAGGMIHAITRFKMIASEEEIMAKAEKEWADTFDAMPDGVSIHNLNHRIVNVNKAMCRLLGKKRDELIGQKCFKIFHDVNQPISGCPMEKTMTSNKMEYAELFEPSLKRWLSVSTSPLFDEKKQLIQIIHVVRDITEIKSKNLELEELNKIKTDFVATVSHELRTPLTIIKEGVSLVLDGFYGEVNDRQKNFLEAAKNNVDRLDRLIGDLLDFSRIESGKIQFNLVPTDLRAIAEKVANHLKIKAAEKNLFLKFEGLGDKAQMVMADPDKVEQLFVNLINNSIKYSDKGGITVSISDQGELIQTCVADTGIGIAKENIPKLFDKFMQFNRNTSPGAQGTGLGLSICWGLVEGMNGKIWAESVLDEGSKFYFTLRKVG